jgi:hypothetical protein
VRALTLDPILRAFYTVHVENFEAHQADLRQDLAVRIANETWKESS